MERQRKRWAQNPASGAFWGAVFQGSNRPGRQFESGGILRRKSMYFPKTVYPHGLRKIGRTAT
jgi:hypothetical protein